MKIFLTVLVMLLLTFVCRFLITRSNLKTIKDLNVQFQLWYTEKVKPGTNDVKIVRPNNEAFSRLYHIVYKDNRAVVNTIDEGKYMGHTATFTNKADVVQSFPTTHQSVVEQEVGLLDNMQDYFQERYNENFRISYWLTTLIFLPQYFIKYIGLKEESILSHVLNAIWWIIIALMAIYKPVLSALIKHLL
ncbi:hypothetical protein KOM07_03255 [Lentilactobacillus sp. G22-6]|uniref:hypothetical protein n=1 Tax=Lentilactobacillus TaxID=2767893 RepID=UPI0010AC9B1A|nr:MULTISPECIES: hypothetical protein [Lentilactobacillus]MBU9788578.1 hypothetical protein [Lentilactobacillus dabitei]TJY12156.1 hypothetical protein FCF15_04230 [Lentilactobacillus buchneri]